MGVFVIPGFPSRSRHSSDKVSKLEGQVESYKKKLEELRMESRKAVWQAPAKS